MSKPCDLPCLLAGDYYLLKNEHSPQKQPGIIHYQITDSKRGPLLESECSIRDGRLLSINLSSVDTNTLLAEITRNSNDTFDVKVGIPVGTIEKTVGWQFRDVQGNIKLGITRQIQTSPSVLSQLVDIAVCGQPFVEGQTTLYHFWTPGNDPPFAKYFADLTNLEIARVDSILTPYICIALALVSDFYDGAFANR